LQDNVKQHSASDGKQSDRGYMGRFTSPSGRDAANRDLLATPTWLLDLEKLDLPALQ
jgi:hypothetical protein